MAAAAIPEARTAAVVYNPIKVKLKELKAIVKVAEAEAGWNKTVWLATSVEDTGGGVTRQAIKIGVDVVMVAGGDGTVRSVGEALRGTNVPMALLPSGTGNLLARNLDMVLDDLTHSARTAFNGQDRRIDIGVVEAERADGTREEFAFLVMAGIGLDAQMVANTNAELKKRVGWLAYVDAIARSLRDSNSVRVRYEIDGQPQQSATVNTIIVGNCGMLTGNILLLPDAVIDDGVFDIVAFRPKGFFGWVQIWIKIVWENGVLRRSTVGRQIMTISREVRALRYLSGKRFTLRLDRPEDFELDGDTFGEAIALRAEVDHLALAVRMPEAELEEA
ncbi:MAG TPA: diacylglycerol kinase family protein [Galbitalea sp.]|jgi:diacylglycerol kinase family enzyme